MSARELPAICYVVECDSCQEPLGDGSGVEMHFESERDAIETAGASDWERAENGALTCYECIQRRPDDDQEAAG